MRIFFAFLLFVAGGKLTRIGGQLVQLGGGVRYWADGPESAPHGWGARLFATLLFPK